MRKFACLTLVSSAILMAAGCSEPASDKPATSPDLGAPAGEAGSTPGAGGADLAPPAGDDTP